MHYSNNPKVVFVAIPKTGTRSIVTYMEDHLNAKKFKGSRTHTVKIPTRLKNHYAFTVVRNPFDRMVSYWWSTCMRPKGSRMEFEAFLQGNRRSHQYPFVTNNKLDKIIRYENLDEEFAAAPFYVEGTSLKHINTTVREWNGIPPRPPTRELITPKIEKMIVEIFAKDFEVLGYPTKYGA